MKHQIIGALTLLSGLSFAIIVVIRSFGGSKEAPKPSVTNTTSFRMQDIDLMSWLPHWTLPDWNPVVWTLVVIACIACLTTIVFAIYGAAKRDRFFMFAEENGFFTIMKGDLPHRFISGVRDMYVVQEGHRIGEVRKIPIDPLPATATAEQVALRKEDEKDYETSKRSLWSLLHWRDMVLMSLFNMQWIGIYPFFQLRTWPLAYNKFVKNSDSKAGSIDYHLTPKSDEARSIFYKSTVGMMFKELETAGKENQVIPVKIELLVTFEATNIYLMQFRTGSNSWLERATGAIEDKLRERVAQHRYFDLLKDGVVTTPETSAAPTELTVATCKKARQEIVEGVMNVINERDGCNPSITEILGVKVIEIRFLSVELDDKLEAQRQELTTAMMAETVKEAQGKGVIKEAAAKAEATRLQAVADNARLKAELEHYSNNPGAVPGLFARSVGTMGGTLVLGEDASKRLTLTAQASHSARPPAPSPNTTQATP
ncbi:MAG: hypothetical protein WCO79_01380 [bacterium]